MSNTEYVRQSADKYGWKKYYSTLRPVWERSLKMDLWIL